MTRWNRYREENASCRRPFVNSAAGLIIHGWPCWRAGPCLRTSIYQSCYRPRARGAQSAPFRQRAIAAGGRPRGSRGPVGRSLRPWARGRWPAVDGFGEAGDLPIDRYERGYYECTFQVVATPAGGATVRASAKITAWYNDPTPARSGYRVLVSNGHIENDFLDQIQEALGPTSVPKPSGSATAAPAAKSDVSAAPPVSSGGIRPQTRLDPAPLDAGESTSNKNAVARDFAAAPRQPEDAAAPTVSSAESVQSLKLQRAAVEKRAQELSVDIKNFEDILHNQARPANLATVKKAGTHVLSKPAEGSAGLFSADAA